MKQRTHAHPQQPTPVTDDAHATSAQLLARAAADYANTHAATRTREQQGGVGTREGILPGGGR